MTKQSCFLLAVFFISGLLAGETLKMETLKIDQPPKLDGKLDEPFWKSAKSLGDFQVWDGPEKGGRATETEAKLAYDNSWFYVGIRCSNPLQKLILAPKVKEHDGPVSQDESVEIFLTADPKGGNYYHFMLSCFNVKAEQRFLNGTRERESWNLPWRSATVIDDKGWTAEIAVPLYLFLEYGDLGHLRLNIAHNRRCPFMDSSNAITHEIIEHEILCPVRNSFHEVDAFGIVAPLKPDKLQAPFIASVENVEVKPYFMKDGKNCYPVDISLKGANTMSGEVDVLVTDTPVSGEKATFRERVALKGTTPQTVSMVISAPAPAERSIMVEARDSVTGESLYKMIIDKPACLKVMTAYLTRNYYTVETEAVAVAEIGMPVETIKGMTVTVELGGKTVGSAPATRETMIKVPLQDTIVGAHPVIIALKRADGAPFCSTTTELIKREPKPGSEIKIDQLNRVVLKEGIPIFPFGPVMGGISPENEVDFKKIADAGCNTFVHWNHWGSKDTAAYLPVAKKYGLQFISLMENGDWLSLKDAGLKTPGQLLSPEEAAAIASENGKSSLTMRGYMLKSKGTHAAKTAVFGEYFDKNIPAIEKIIAGIKNADNLLAYNSFDEPCDNSFFQITKYLDALYRLTQRSDGYHPVMLILGGYIPEGDKYDEYMTGCDILVTDPYWVPCGNMPGRNTPNFVAKSVYWQDKRAEKFRKVAWTVPVGWVWSGITRSKRGISGPEQNCQSFLAVIQGARGIFWFCYPFPEPAWTNLKETMAMIKVIGPMAVQPKIEQTISYLRASEPDRKYTDVPFIPEKDEFPDVQGRIFRDPNGGFVMVVANSRYYPVTATFTVLGLADKVERLFSKATLPVKDGIFTEPLEPFAVRAYHLGNALKIPAALTIAALRPKPIPPQEVSYPGNARPDRKNTFPNPSFEDETIPGQPDYYYFNGNDIIALEKDNAKFGNKCLKLSIEKSKGYASVNWLCAPQHDKPTPYVWSFWAKGAKGGESLFVRKSPEDISQTFTLTSEWKHYELPLVLAARASINTDGAFAIRMTQSGTVWIDGMQFEQGVNATDFEE